MAMMFPVLSRIVVDSFHEVFGVLGPGLLENCYHNALFYSLKKCCDVVYNQPYEVVFDGKVVGEYLADLVVNSKIIIEVKAVRAFSDSHAAQLLNYLHISGCSLGFLVNFQNKYMQFKRFII